MPISNILSRLITTLVASKVKASDNPLYQTIDGILKYLIGVDTIITTIQSQLTAKIPAAYSDIIPANPTGTASTTRVMMGLAAYITPLYSTRVLFIITGNLTNSGATAGQGTSCRIRYGTGTAPINGAVAVGTNASDIARSILERNAADLQPFTCQGIVTTLSPGTRYWFDLSLAAITSGTGAAQDLTITGLEV